MSKKQFRQLFAESLLESPVSLTDKAAIPACNLFSTECNQQNKHKIILLVADCCVGTWRDLMCQLLLCFVLFVCLFLAVLMDFTSLLLSSENMKKIIQVVWMPKWFHGEIWLHSIHFWNWWSLYIFTWLHLYKIWGLLNALSGDEGSTLGFVRIPVHCALHHFTAGTLLNCCHHPEQSFYASLNLVFLSPRKTGIKHAKIFCGKMKEREKYEIFICISISANFFLFTFTFSVYFHLSQIY